MELYETIEGMTSTDYRERFKAEYRQTKIRYEKLKDFCNRIEAAERTGTEQPEHRCPLGLLQEQQKYMGLYLKMMEIRAVIEEVELKEEKA
mgnify:FL=1